MLAKKLNVSLLFLGRRKNLSRDQSILLSLTGLLSAIILIAMWTGAVNITPIDWALGKLNSAQASVLYMIRLPRVVLAAVVGSSLAVCGAAIQGLFRNPLADTGLLGISSGAALAVALVIVFSAQFVGALGLYTLSIAAFIGGLITCAIIFRIAQMTGSFSITYLLLAGIAINSLAGSGIGLMTYLSDDQQLRTLTFWMLGSLGGANWSTVAIVSSVVIPCNYLLYRQSQALNITLLGEEEASYLGVNHKHLKYWILMCTALSVGVCVSATGMIGFIGLVIPHLIRLLIGADHRILIPASAILGAVLLLSADTISRSIVSPSEMPVGIVTSLIGGPCFLWLLIKQYSGHRVS